MATTFVTPTLSWMHNGIEQVVAFANADDAKTCWQALAFNGIHASFSIPEDYKEIPFRHYEGDGLLFNAEVDALKAKLEKMVLVH